MFTSKVYKNLASIMAKNRSQKNSCITNITDLDEIATDDHETDNHSPGPLTQLMDDHSLHYQRSHRPGPSDIHMDVDEDGGDPDETLDTVESTPTSKSGYRPSSPKAIEEIGDRSVTEGKGKRSIMDKKDFFLKVMMMMQAHQKEKERISRIC